MNNNSSVVIVLGSASPRRKMLLESLGITIQIKVSLVEENILPGTHVEDAPLYLAKKKAESIFIKPNELLITADTVVILDHEIINKPTDFNNAVELLSKLSGRTHRVISAVCFTTHKNQETTVDTSWVTFNTLSVPQIQKYIHVFQPYDKAGGYGAQECLPYGMNPCSNEEVEFLKSVGQSDLGSTCITYEESNNLAFIKKIDGSFFNVIGLPLHRVYTFLTQNKYIQPLK